MIRAAAQCGKRICSSQCWEPVPTSTRKPHRGGSGIRRCDRDGHGAGPIAVLGGKNSRKQARASEALLCAIDSGPVTRSISHSQASLRIAMGLRFENGASEFVIEVAKRLKEERK